MSDRKKTMKLWLLRPFHWEDREESLSDLNTDEALPDEDCFDDQDEDSKPWFFKNSVAGFVIMAENERQARQIAAEAVGEGYRHQWSDGHLYTSCYDLGSCNVEDSGNHHWYSARIIMVDFQVNNKF